MERERLYTTAIFPFAVIRRFPTVTVYSFCEEAMFAGPIVLRFSLFLVLYFCQCVPSLAKTVPCPFEQSCTCYGGKRPFKRFESAECSFDEKKQFLFKPLRGKYKILGELSISGPFAAKTMSHPDNSLANTFESIGKLTFVNTAEGPWDLSKSVPAPCVVGTAAETMAFVNFRNFHRAMSSYKRYRVLNDHAEPWEYVKKLEVGQSILNELSHKTLETFPKLESITLVNNQFTMKPDHLAFDVDAFQHHVDTLQEVAIMGCGLEEIPDALNKLVNLKVLNLANNGMHTLSPCPLCQFKKLEELQLSGNELSPAYEERLFDKLPKTLRILGMESSKLTHIPYRAIEGDEISLTKISLANNDIEELDSNSIPLHNRLEYLNLDNNPIRHIDADALGRAKYVVELSMKNIHVEEFDISWLKGMNKLKVIAIDESPELKKLLLSSIEAIPKRITRITATNLKLDKVQATLQHLLERDGFEHVDLSDSTLSDCDADTYKWMAKYVFCEPDRLKVENLLCPNSEDKLLSEILEKPDCGDGETAEDPTDRELSEEEPPPPEEVEEKPKKETHVTKVNIACTIWNMCSRSDRRSLNVRVHTYYNGFPTMA